MPGETGPSSPNRPAVTGSASGPATSTPAPVPPADNTEIRTRREIREEREAERRGHDAATEAGSYQATRGRPAERSPAERPGSRLEAERPSPGVRTSRVVLRRVDPWAVMKISLLFYLSMFVVLLVAGILLWLGARSAGVIGNVESFMDEIGFTDFEFVPGQILRGSAIAGLVLVVAGTFGNILMSVLYNLIADVLGGFKITLAEDEPPRRRI